MQDDTSVSRRGSAIGFELRPVTAMDVSFLRELYRTTRERELACVPWSEMQKAAFCDMQFNLQTMGYRQMYPHSEHAVVCADGGEPAGRLITARSPAAIQLVDISLLPAFRGRGWGSALLGRLLADARKGGVAVKLTVEKSNPAFRLYKRMGFEVMEDDELRFVMSWRHDGSGAS